ncbi:MAG: glycosyltransferase family 2 protein [bacterium]|nr:glycosyltransferase family 2 protein [bacterium]
MHPITVTIIACDEEQRIAAAIASAQWADEILVLDSGSSDRTVAIARNAGARVVQTDWPGYGVQKNRAGEMAANRWLFSLDADEQIGDELQTSIRDLPEDPKESAFRVRRRNRVGGKAIRHWPWAWDKTVRLYDRRKARFSEVPVHESLQVDGVVGDLGGLLEHDTYSDWLDCCERQEQYARLSVEAMVEDGRRSRLIDRTARPFATLLRLLVVRGHVLSGITGLRYAWCVARGTFLKYELLRNSVTN